MDALLKWKVAFATAILVKWCKHHLDPSRLYVRALKEIRNPKLNAFWSPACAFWSIKTSKGIWMTTSLGILLTLDSFRAVMTKQTGFRTLPPGNFGRTIIIGRGWSADVYTSFTISSLMLWHLQNLIDKDLQNCFQALIVPSKVMQQLNGPLYAWK